VEEKSRKKFALLIAVILTAAVAYSFLFNLFNEPPSVSLSPDSTMPGSERDPLSSGELGTRVEVTTETVQKVVECLSRYRSYSRNVKVEYFSGGMSVGTLSAAVSVDSGWTRVDLTSVGGTEHTIIGTDECYRWYGDNREYVSLPVEEGMDDLSQRIPTYETVLSLKKENITAANYVDRGGVACIYVETLVDEFEYLERYWISVESGLLVAAETVRADQLIYSMTAYEVESPLADFGDRFTLPDGIVLH